MKYFKYEWLIEVLVSVLAGFGVWYVTNDIPLAWLGLIIGWALVALIVGRRRFNDEKIDARVFGASLGFVAMMLGISVFGLVRDGGSTDSLVCVGVVGWVAFFGGKWWKNGGSDVCKRIFGSRRGPQ